MSNSLASLAARNERFLIQILFVLTKKDFGFKARCIKFRSIVQTPDMITVKDIWLMAGPIKIRKINQTLDVITKKDIIFEAGLIKAPQSELSTAFQAP